MCSEMRYRLQHKQSRVYLEQQATANPAFAAFLAWCEEDDRCGRMEFHDLLFQPLQRLTRYPLLLKAILKRLPEPREVRHVQQRRRWPCWAAQGLAVASRLGTGL